MYNIWGGLLSGAAVRFAKRNTTLEDFRANMLRMVGRMATLGYSHRKMNSQFSKFAQRFMGRYGINSMAKVRQQVAAALVRL